MSRRLRPIQVWVEGHDRLQALHLLPEVIRVRAQPGPGAYVQDTRTDSQWVWGFSPGIQTSGLPWGVLARGPAVRVPTELLRS